MKQVLDEILEKLPDEFNVPEMMARAEERTPYTVVAFQECERMNNLTSEMRRSLKELDLGLKVTRSLRDVFVVVVVVRAAPSTFSAHPRFWFGDQFQLPSNFFGVTKATNTFSSLYILFQNGARSEKHWGELHEGEASRAKHRSAIILQPSQTSSSSVHGGRQQF